MLIFLKCRGKYTGVSVVPAQPVVRNGSVKNHSDAFGSTTNMSKLSSSSDMELDRSEFCHIMRCSQECGAKSKFRRVSIREKPPRYNNRLAVTREGVGHDIDA